MDILIVEDEPRAAEQLKALSIAIDASNTVIGITSSINETVKWLNSHNAPDVILMDIHLADGNCFSIFEVCETSAPIIFCTAYDEYALKAFQSNGIAYLLKPIAGEDLQGALGKLERLRQTLTSRELSFRRQVFRHLGVREGQYKSRFLIKAGEKLLPIPTDTIACFISEQHGLKVYLFNGDSYFIEYTLKELAEVLNPDSFFQINRQAIISDKAVISATANLRKANVRLSVLEHELPIARNRALSFRHWLEK